MCPHVLCLLICWINGNTVVAFPSCSDAVTSFFPTKTIESINHCHYYLMNVVIRKMWIFVKNKCICITAWARCICASAGSVYTSHGYFTYYWDEGQEHRYNQNTYISCSHWWKLPRQIMAWGERFIRWTHLHWWLFLYLHDRFLLVY